MSDLQSSVEMVIEILELDLQNYVHPSLQSVIFSIKIHLQKLVSKRTEDLSEFRVHGDN